MGDSVYILSIDAKDLWLSNHQSNNSNGYSIRSSNGDFNTRKFTNSLDYSLELIKLRDVYRKTIRRKNFTFSDNDKEYTQHIVNVTFKYCVKEWNLFYGNVYVKYGHSIADIELHDGVCFSDGKLIAVQVNTPIHSPQLDDQIHFFFEKGVYKARDNMKTLYNIAELRRQLYHNGFLCDGIRYVRYKRSAGSSRVGKCLFINEVLYPKMLRWALGGIRVEEGQEVELSALESYIALSLSSIVGTIDIEPKNILVLEDAHSVFYDDVAVVRDGKRGLEVQRDRVEITNSIWDGQSLIDPSLMGEYNKHGFILLRNRFFKSACFNTNLQKWFHDHQITDVRQLKGRTIATDIQDVKFVTTPSSIKYLKFKPLNDWFKHLDSQFGVVKFDKKTPFFDGRMVQAHYQLLNTLQLSQEAVQELAQPSFEYIRLIKTCPAALRHHIKYTGNEYQYQSIQSKNDLVYRLLGHNELFSKTKLYRDFRNDVIRSLLKNLRCGHILINGNYSTLFGNPIEMLQTAIGAFDGKSDLGSGNICSSRFPKNTAVLGSRSPHITMGNILVANNVRSEAIDTYFNLTPEIVCVNSIGENLLARLSGSDFDSDTVLLTDNPILLAAAQKNYHDFLVPTGDVSAIKVNRCYTSDQKADLDIKTSVNKIGEIINLSQELNSFLWDQVNSGVTIEDLQELYNDIALLDVLSNLEIDKAKREYNVDSTFELRRIKEKYVQTQEGRTIKPLFFAALARIKGYYDNEKKHYLPHKTTMDYLQKSINRFRSPKEKQEFLPLSEILAFKDYNIHAVYFVKVHKIMDMVRSCRCQINCLWNTCNNIEMQEKYCMANEIKRQCQEYINNAKLNPSTLFYMMRSIELPNNSDIKNLLFELLFSSSHTGVYKMINKSKEGISSMRENDTGDIRMYEYRYSIIPCEK